MAAIKIGGKEYALRMDIYAMEQIEKEFGDMKEALRLFQSKDRKVGMIKTMFRILANSGAAYAGKEENATGEELNGCNLGDLDQIVKALNKTLQEAMHAETVGGNEADDEVHDEYMDELEQKEKNA